MGMYTELNLGVQLKKDTPDLVIKTLQYMVRKGEEEEEIETPEHELFKTDRWQIMLICDSYSFDAETDSKFNYDKIAEQWYLTIQCNFKNYNDELEKFCDWISPYIDAEDDQFLGHSRYEEAEDPTLLYYHNSKIIRKQPTFE